MRPGTGVLRRTVAVFSLPLFVACSTGKPPSGDDTTGSGGTGNGGAGGAAASAATGTGGSAAMSQGGAAGVAATGGGSAAAGSGVGGSTAGASAAAGLGGSVGGAAGASGSSARGGSGGLATAGTGGTDPGICEELSVVSKLEIPIVELLVDTSSSMWETEPPAWPILYDAMMGEGGVVPTLGSSIRFGFASYKGSSTPHAEDDPACATMTTVPPALDNLAAIDAAYEPLDALWMNGVKWETPTNYAITYATKTLVDYNPDPPGKKYILLVTDGNPNTCQVQDPQCGEDLAIKATQDAFAAGVGLFVLGVGDIVKQPKNFCPTSARCGKEHLQDLANAGVGAGVHPTPGCDDWHDSGCTFTHEACNQGGLLLATYTPEAPDVGTPFSVDTSATNAKAAVVAALSSLLEATISCTVDMDAVVTGDPTLGKVNLEGSPLAYNEPNGWMLEADAHSVTLKGAACESFKAGQKALDITFPCDPSGNPIAVHR